MASSNTNTKPESTSTSLGGLKELLKKGWNEVVRIRSKKSNEEPAKYKPRGKVVKPTGGTKPKPKPRSQFKPTLSGDR
ncbi:hypothetical protein K435DRAFT_785316 [Dendrothele bispora CBS 962.96]|uniref:Uncharacterized protein n=1 Tax=Dendrothele bispora (strain CBS 962.96) TaxID=1314807 RepID=A0A4S8KXN9_DENBC|nr:hypothetical protein K435DRAFT_785316 [Dendrothele bispora CBS 962.96]